MKNIQTLATKAHAIARSKGFWEEGSNKNKPGQMLMLIVSELGEALEGLRKGRLASEILTNTDHPNRNVTKLEYFLYRTTVAGTDFRRAFEEYVKDSFEDEVADAIIRLFDFVGGYGIDIDVRPRDIDHAKEFLHDCDSQGDQLLLITHRINHLRTNLNNISRNGAASNTLAYLLAFAEMNGIDKLEQHIELKMQYNETRPMLNGKKF